MTTLKFIFPFLFLFSSCPEYHTKTNSSFTQKDVLKYMEENGQETWHFFIDFEHPYFFTAGSRLTLYADRTRWAIVFEKSGYSTGNNCAEIELAYFGNCLENLKSEIPGNTSTSNMHIAILINETDLEKIDDGEFEEIVAMDKNQIKVRDTLLPIEHDTSKYYARRIRPEDYPNPKKLIDFPSLIRYLDEEHPQLFRATDHELRKCLPAGLPMLMHINQWHHEAYSKNKQMTSPSTYTEEVIGMKPGDYETYRMIADILVSKDTTKWKPSLKPNNDWRNWPRAGHM